MTFLGSALMLLGATLAFIAGFGLVRLPSGLSRVHAAAKPASLGLALIAIGAGVASRSWGLAATGVLVAVLQFLTAPIAGHLLGRALSPVPSSFDAREGALDAASPKRRNWSLVFEAAVIWLVLWRDLSLANVVAGLGIGVVLAVLAPARETAHVRPLGAVASLGRYLLSLVRANVRMAQQVLTVPDDELEETLVVCDLETRVESVAFFDANATSFAPGTLTLEISADSPYRMAVHAIGQSEEEVRAGVAELESSAAKIFD